MFTATCSWSVTLSPKSDKDEHIDYQKIFIHPINLNSFCSTWVSLTWFSGIDGAQCGCSVDRIYSTVHSNITHKGMICLVLLWLRYWDILPWVIQKKSHCAGTRLWKQLLGCFIWGISVSNLTFNCQTFERIKHLTLAALVSERPVWR